MTHLATELRSGLDKISWIRYEPTFWSSVSGLLICSRHQKQHGSHFLSDFGPCSCWMVRIKIHSRLHGTCYGPGNKGMGGLFLPRWHGGSCPPRMKTENWLRRVVDSRFICSVSVQLTNMACKLAIYAKSHCMYYYTAPHLQIETDTQMTP